MRNSRGPSGSAGGGGSVDLSTVLLLDGSQKMTSNLDMNSKKVINLSDPSGATDASNKNVDTIKNNILNSSETLQGNINVNNHRIINLHTPTSNNDAVNKAF